MKERYQPGSSPLHRLDPRVKVAVTFVLILGIVLTPGRAWPAYPLLWALLGSMAALAGLGAGRVARMGTVALPFTLAAATLLVTTPGEPLAEVVGLTITDNGLARFLAIVLKSWLAVQVALLLSLTTDFFALLWAFRSLRVPATLVAIIAVMYRYLFTLRDEAERLLRARAARSGTTDGHPSGGGLGWRARVAGGMVGNLFLRSFERGERVYAAMLARGYSGEMRMLDPPALTRRDVFAGLVPVLVLIFIEILAIFMWSG